jgi:hypothetical protein
MDAGEIPVERRKQSRLQLRGDGVALLRTPSSKSTIVGEIMDISVDGVSFQYISGEEPDQEATELSLVSADHSFYLNRLPIKTISDLEMAKIPFGSVSTRRRGVKFGKLGKNHKFALQHFIRHYTTPIDSDALR